MQVITGLRPVSGGTPRSHCSASPSTSATNRTVNSSGSAQVNARRPARRDDVPDLLGHSAYRAGLSAQELLVAHTADQ